MRRSLAGITLLTCALVLISPVAGRADDLPAWRSVPLPYLRANAYLGSISAADPHHIWVTGNQGQWCWPGPGPLYCSLGDSAPAALRWTGDSWAQYPIEGRLRLDIMQSVTATTPDDVWMMGLGRRTAHLYRFDGTAIRRTDWTPQDGVILVHGGPGGAWKVSADSSRREEIDRLLRLEDGRWQPHPLPITMNSITEVKVRTATDIWAVGSVAGPAPDRPVMAAVRWDGRSWHAVPTPPDEPRLDSVLPVSATEVYAIGGDHIRGERAWRWDGTGWTRLPDDGIHTTTLARDAAGHLWVGGSHSAGRNERAVLARLSGGQWQQAPIGIPEGTTIRRINDMVPVPGTGALWAVASADPGPVVLTDR